MCVVEFVGIGVCCFVMVCGGLLCVGDMVCVDAWV